VKNNKFYLVILGIIISTMLISLIGCGSEKKMISINVGEYASFGRYKGDPILWKCVDNSN